MVGGRTISHTPARRVRVLWKTIRVKKSPERNTNPIGPFRSGTRTRRSECIQAHRNTQTTSENACHEKYYSAACNVLAGMGTAVGVGIGGGP